MHLLLLPQDHKFLFTAPDRRRRRNRVAQASLFFLSPPFVFLDLFPSLFMGKYACVDTHTHMVVFLSTVSNLIQQYAPSIILHEVSSKFHRRKDPNK